MPSAGAETTVAAVFEGSPVGTAIVAGTTGFPVTYAAVPLGGRFTRYSTAAPAASSSRTDPPPQPLKTDPTRAPNRITASTTPTTMRTVRAVEFGRRDCSMNRSAGLAGCPSSGMNSQPMRYSRTPLPPKMASTTSTTRTITGSMPSQRAKPPATPARTRSDWLRRRGGRGAGGTGVVAGYSVFCVMAPA